MTRARGRAARLRLADRLLVEKLAHPTFKTRQELDELADNEPDPDPPSAIAERRRVLWQATKELRDDDQSDVR